MTQRVVLHGIQVYCADCGMALFSTGIREGGKIYFRGCACRQAQEKTFWQQLPCWLAVPQDDEDEVPESSLPSYRYPEVPTEDKPSRD